MRFPCLVLDHDDTVVRSEETVNFPQFEELLAELRPEAHITRAEFSHICMVESFSGLYRKYSFTPEEEAYTDAHWRRYVRVHIPPAYDGMRELLQRHKARGGFICVVSHSMRENILRDYELHFQLVPDLIYDWNLGEELRKPNPYPLQDIMRRTGYAPEQLLMVDDLKLGLDMALACHVPFACAGWSHDFPEIAAVMRANSRLYFTKVSELADFLEHDGAGVTFDK